MRYMLRSLSWPLVTIKTTNISSVLVERNAKYDQSLRFANHVTKRNRGSGNENDLLLPEFLDGQNYKPRTLGLQPHFPRNY